MEHSSKPGQHEEALKPRNEDRGKRAHAASGGRNEEVNFHGEKRSNQTHSSTSDPRCHALSQGVWHGCAKLCFIATL